MTSGSGCCNMPNGPNFLQVIKSRYIQFKIHFIYIFIKFFFFWFSCTESAAAAYFPLMPTALAHLTTSSYGAAQRSCTLAQTTTCRLICTRITPAVTYNFHCAFNPCPIFCTKLIRCIRGAAGCEHNVTQWHSGTVSTCGAAISALLPLDKDPLSARRTFIKAHIRD